MLNVQKTAVGHYTISLSEGSVDAGYTALLEDETPPLGEPATHNFTAEITIEINEDFASYARGMCSSNLNLGVGLGSKANELAILKGMLRGPLPMSPAYTSGVVPEMTSEELGDIATNLESVQRDLSVTITANVSNGKPMSLVCIPDARGFDYKLVDLSQGVNLYSEHAFVMTNSFIIDTLPIADLAEGPGSKYTQASMDDAKVYILNKEKSILSAETLTTEFARTGRVERQGLIDAYYKLLNEMFWRSQSVAASRVSSRPYVSHLYGIGLSGRSLTVVSMDGLSGLSIKPGINLNLRGTAHVQYIYGDIRFPVDPQLSASRPKFDIISDSEDWTKYGPLSVRYIGGVESEDSPSTIFSWEGRVSIFPKVLPQVAAGLEYFNGGN